MNKYLKQAGFRESEKNDLGDRDFYLSDVMFQNGIATTLNNFKVDYVEFYDLFLKKLNVVAFKETLEEMVANALADGLKIDEVEVGFNRVENGYKANLKITYKG